MQPRTSRGYSRIYMKQALFDGHCLWNTGKLYYKFKRKQTWQQHTAAVYDMWSRYVCMYNVLDNMRVSFDTWITQYALHHKRNNKKIYIYIQLYIYMFFLQSRHETFCLVSFNPSWSELVEPSAQVQPGQPGFKDPWFFSCWDRKQPRV